MLLQSEIWAIAGKNEWGLNLAFTLSCSRYTSQTSQQTSFLLEILILAGRTFLTGQNDSLVLLKETLRILPERSACKTKKNSVLPWIWIVTICNEYPLAESYRFSYLIMPVWTPSHKGYVWNVNHFFAVAVHLIIWIEWFKDCSSSGWHSSHSCSQFKPCTGISFLHILTSWCSV